MKILISLLSFVVAKVELCIVQFRQIVRSED